MWAATGHLWHLPNPYGASSPAICGSFAWFVGTKYGRGLFKIGLSAGKVLWRHRLDSRGTRPVYAEGVVYLGTHAGTVFALNAVTGRKPHRSRRSAGPGIAGARGIRTGWCSRASCSCCTPGSPGNTCRKSSVSAPA
ncbi:hypothetical protein GPN2_20960 [Streptomyces murinus]